MKLLKTMAIAMLGSATLLPTLPAWADDAKPAATDAVKSTAAPAPPLTVTAKPGQMDNGSREQAMAMRRNDRKAFMDARLAALHAGLQLTAQQQPLWDPVESALRGLGEARHAMHRFRREDRETRGGDSGSEQMDTTARLEQRGERLIAMGQAIGKLADATGPLLGSLTPEQKGRLPVLLHGMGPHRLVKQAFGVDGRDDKMMGDGERSMRHRHFADSDGRERPDADRPGFGHPGFDRRAYGRDNDPDGWHQRHRGWDREGRADRDGLDSSRYDREDGQYRRHDNDRGKDERIGG